MLCRWHIVCFAHDGKIKPWGHALSPEEIVTALQTTPHDQLASIAATLHHGNEVHNVAAMSDAELIKFIQSANIEASHTGPIAFGGYFFWYHRAFTASTYSQGW
jgi:hypothetical protein